jgi:hypothetical protein
MTAAVAIKDGAQRPSLLDVGDGEGEGDTSHGMLAVAASTAANNAVSEISQLSPRVLVRCMHHGATVAQSTAELGARPYW